MTQVTFPRRKDSASEKRFAALLESVTAKFASGRRDRLRAPDRGRITRDCRTIAALLPAMQMLVDLSASGETNFTHGISEQHTLGDFRIIAKWARRHGRGVRSGANFRWADASRLKSYHLPPPWTRVNCSASE